MQLRASWLASLTPPQRAKFLASLSPSELVALEHDWRFWARDDQLPPPGPWWRIWLALAGRGWGKTRVGAETTIEIAAEAPQRIALVGPTEKDVRGVMVEGESGILACSKPWFMPIWEPSVGSGRLTWPNGSQAFAYSADVPRSLRGPQHHASWCDELAAWRRMRDTWDMLRFGLRLGQRPRTIITTTPTPAKLIKELMSDDRRGPDGLPLVRVTRGSTYDNAANLAEDFLAELKAKYEGTRLGRQELHAEILTDKPGALWTLTVLERHRAPSVDHKVPETFQRVVVAVDPPTTSGPDSDECGIVVAGLGPDGRGYVLDDKSERGLSPKQWAEKAVSAYVTWGADRLVAESNQGGEMVENTIRQVMPEVSYRGVHAYHGKRLRAEPVSALYEQGRVSHVGFFKALEDQMTDFTADFDPKKAGCSPDRLDALVHALTELMLGGAGAAPNIRRL